MSTATLISVEEYLNTSYPDGDREYVDGRIVELGMADVDHGLLQLSIGMHLRSHYKQLCVGTAIRVQATKTRYRVADVVAVLGPRPSGRVITSPPLFVVEIVSPDDRAEELQEKIDEYLAFGIPYVWVVNPRTRRGYVYTVDGMREAKDGVLRIPEPAIEVPLGAMFSAS